MKGRAADLVSEKYLLLEKEGRGKQFTLRWALAIGGLLTLVKLAGFLLTGSNAVLADALESIINIVAVCFALYSLHLANRPRDFLRPYGHGKIESLAAATEGALVFLSGLYIIYRAAQSLSEPHQVTNLLLGLSLVGGAALVNTALGWYLYDRGSKLDSPILKSDGRRLMTDAISSAAVCIGLIVLWITGWEWVDGVLSIGAGLFILYTGYRIISHSIQGLLDTADLGRITELLTVIEKRNRPEWIDIDQLRANHYGMYLHIDCRLTLPWYMNLREVDSEIKELQGLIDSNFKEEVHFIVSPEPCTSSNCSLCRLMDCPVRQVPFHGKFSRYRWGAGVKL